jgi:hypothetical protein
MLASACRHWEKLRGKASFKAKSRKWHLSNPNYKRHPYFDLLSHLYIYKITKKSIVGLPYGSLYSKTEATRVTANLDAQWHKNNFHFCFSLKPWESTLLLFWGGMGEGGIPGHGFLMWPASFSVADHTASEYRTVYWCYDHKVWHKLLSELSLHYAEWRTEPCLAQTRTIQQQNTIPSF